MARDIHRLKTRTEVRISLIIEANGPAKVKEALAAALPPKVRKALRRYLAEQQDKGGPHGPA